MFSPIIMFVLICVLLCLHTVKCSNNLIWKPYVNATVPEDCIPIPGQTELYIGLAYVDKHENSLLGLIPTTVQNGSEHVNVTINFGSYSFLADEVDLKILCGIENSEGKLDFVSTTSEEFPSLLDSNTKPITVGWEYNPLFIHDPDWWNLTLYTGIVSPGMHRLIVAKMYEYKVPNYLAYYSDIYDEFLSGEYDVLVLRT